jgi:hypothetical protein
MINARGELTLMLANSSRNMATLPQLGQLEELKESAP